MSQALVVALGGALGSLARWRVGLALAAAPGGTPWGTLVVNVAGSLFLGLVLASWPAERPGLWRLFLGVGVCGGFTTFSTFSAELVQLAARGHVVRAAGYAAASLALGVAAVAAGLALGRAMAR